MKTTLILSLVVLLMLAFNVQADQPVRSMTLPNGLDLVMMPDASTPLLSSMLIVRAGSGNETLADAGATHLLEHMIFRGTTNRTQDEIYDAFARMGAYYNAQTSKTYTNFILVTPVEHALNAMEIQADMVLNSVIDPDTLVIEKGRVINEIHQSLERSSTLAENKNSQIVYAPSSYGFSTLGTVQGITQIPAANVIHFHTTWYAVNNMTLVMRGDLNFTQMEQLAIEVYGSHTPRDLPERTEAWPSGFDDWRGNKLHVSYGAEQNGSLTMTVAAPRYDAADMPAFNALTLMLNDQLAAQLQSGMPLVTYAYSSIDNDPDFSVMTINAGLMPDSDPNAVVEGMLKAVQSLSPTETSLKEIQLAMRDERQGELFFAEQVQYGSFLLVPKLAVAPWGFWKEFERDRSSLTLSDLEAAYRFWFENPTWIASAYLPDEDESAGSGLTMGPIVDKTLPNGMRVIVRELQGAPVAGIHLAVNGRSSWEDESTQGWVDLLHRLMMKGENSDTFDDSMGEIGMEMAVVDDPRVPMDNYRTVPEYSFVRVQSISENWSDAIQFVADRVISTSFDEDDIAEAGQDQLRIANRDRSKLRSMANGQFSDMLYGDHVRSAPIYGSEASMADISRDDLLEFRKDAFSAENLVLSVLAPAPATQIIEVIEEAFRELPRSASHLPLQDMPVSVAGVDTVRAPGRQGYLATGFLIPEIAMERRAAALLANVMVSDRIYRDLGEKKGWAYSAGSSLLLRDGWGAWMSRMTLPEEHLAESQSLVYQHLSVIANGDFDEDRLEIARNDMRGSLLRRYSSRINLAMALSVDAVLYDEPNQTWLLYEQLGNVTLDEVKQAAFDLFHQPENIITVYGLPEGEMEMPRGMPMGGMGGMGGR